MRRRVIADLASLVIKLSADVASLQSDLGKANAMSKASADGIAKSFQGALGGVKDTVKEFAGALVAAFTIDKAFELTKSVIDLGDNLNKMSQKVGVSVESLSAMRNAAALSDVSTEDLGGAMAKLARTATEAAGGSKQQAAAFSAIGVAVKDANGQMRPMQDILTSVAAKFATYQDGASKTALAQDLFGKSGAQLIPLLNQLGIDGFDKVTQAAKDYNQVIGAEQAKQSEEFNDNLTRLASSATGFASAVVKDLLPGLVSITNQMAQSAKTTDGYASSAGGVATVIKSVVFALLSAKEITAGVATGIFAFFDAIKLTFEASGKLIVAWSLSVKDELVAAFKMDGAGIAAARANFAENAKSIGESFSKGMAGVSAGFNGGVSDSVNNIEKDFDSLFGTFSNVSSGADTTAKSIAHLQAPIVASGDAAAAAQKAADAYAASVNKAAEMLAKFEGAVDPSAKALQTFVRAQIDVNAQAADMVEKGKAAGEGQIAFAQAQEFATRASAANLSALQKQNAAIAKQGDVLGNYLDEVKKANALTGLSDREKAIATALQKATDEFDKNTKAGIKNQQSIVELTTGVRAAAGAAFDLAKRSADVEGFVSQFGQVSEFEKLQKGIEEVGKALDEAIGKGQLEKAKILMRTLEGMRGALVGGIVAGAKEGLQSLQSMTTEGSKSFRELQVAIDLTTIAEGVLAIIHQLSAGDVYSAIPRAIAVAAAIASLGVDVGNLGGGSGGSNSSASRQASQGTGTVLGDATAKSESIAKATEITANATTQLVGLNRGMLTALQALQSALGAASNQLARGAGNASFAGPKDNIINLAGPGSSDPIGGMLGSFLFGGAQSIVDKGIIIAGGALNDMLHSIVVGAYQTIQTTGGLFGSDKTSDQLSDVSAGFSKQFQLVIQSIADTVKAGATALGVLPADIEAAMAKFKVEEIRISLEGLSADDQQKAIEAVFSSIFDGLAGAVVPFIDQFQKAGEGLGETLVRIATEVQVTQEAFKQLGLSVSVTDPEKFAQLADGLVQAAGGIDDFISGMQSFVANFSDAGHQMDVSSSALASAFSQVGLTVPETSQGMWDLMQSLDATTESGQAQIATLLRLSDTAKSYYDQLDEFSKTLGLDGNSQFNRDLNSIRDASIGLIKALSKAGASTETLQHVYDASVDKINELVAQMEASAQSIAFSLGISNKGSLDEVTSEINRLQGIADSASGSVQGFGNAMQEASRQASDAIALLLGDLSPLNDQKKLQIALAGLQSGTVTQDQVLEIGRRLYASTQKYNDLFAMVQQYPGSSGAADGVESSAGGVQSQGLTQAQSDRLQDLLKEQVTLQAAAQLGQYQDLAQRIAQIAMAKGVDWQQVIDEMGIKNADLEKGLGLANDDALKTYIENEQKNNKDGTTSIVTVLTQIRDILSGNPTNDETTPEVPSMAHSGRGNTPTDIAITMGQVIGNHIGHTLAPYQGNQPRSSRVPVRVN